MTPTISIILILLPSLFTSHTTSRRILHQPFFPVTDPPPPPPQTTTQPPLQPPQPSPLPKQPFSSISSPTTPTHHHTTHDHHFFPLFTTPPTTTTTLPTFPANFTSITIPSSHQTPSSKVPHNGSKKLILLSLTLSLVSIALISTMVATFFYHRSHHREPPDNHHLLPPNHQNSDKPPPLTPPSLPPNSSNPSTEFLYLGTLFSPMHSHANVTNDFMGSPELHPLPPLVRKVHANVEEGEKVVVAAPPSPPVMEAGGGSGGGGVKMKGLYWDKVKGGSDKAMVWDKFKFSSSFRVNEEMMETLFTANPSKPAPNHRTNQPVAENMNQRIRVLDPHKSRNIAILLRAFNLTIDEVCESILQGNVDTLGSELLGSLLKMTPTVDEEIRLKELNDMSLVELDPAEKFLKAVIDIPFAFKRVDAMLYISNFDTEVEYLKASFETIKSACRQLKNSRMFIRLLEAVLMAGNRMNIGTNRGDAQAFKLDTLLKLIDIKGTDGKTTLLHFVVHEITKAESRLSGFNQQPELYNEVESRKSGLEMVSSLSGELSSVKKAAAIDYDILSIEVGKLAMGLTKIREVVALNEQSCSNDSFLDSMTMFLRKAEADIVNIKDEERVTILMVKDITEYFHGSLTTEDEKQPLWIFMVVRDFLLVLDRVCKEVGKINERTTVGSQSLPPSVFPTFNGRRGFSSF